MNSKTLVLLCAISASALSTSAFSQEFCNNPMKKVCEDTQAVRDVKTNYIKALKMQINAEASVASEIRIKQMKKEVSMIHIFKRAFLSYKIRTQEVMKAAKGKIGGFEGASINPENVARLKSYMNVAIDQSHFEPMVKETFKTIMSTVIIGNFSDFLDRVEADENVLAPIIRECGLDGLAENAFATTIKDQKYVLVCPGLLISLSQTTDKEAKFNEMLHTIGHEMGHHIDNSSVGNQLYLPFLNCIANNYVGEFNVSADDQKYCKKNSMPNCIARVTLSHSGELVADAWGTKLLNIHARTQNYSVEQTSNLLVSSWSVLCAGGDEGIHPSTPFRLNFVRKDPDMSSYLRCDNSAVKEKPACTLEGAVNL